MLNARGSKARHALTFDGALPRGKFFERKSIAFASFWYRKQTAIDGCDNFGLATNDPSRSICGR